MKEYYVYILASQYNGTLYVGFTSNLIQRIYQHKHGMVEGFTKHYNVHMLVYYEKTTDVYTALQREKQLKSWRRQYKIDLINDCNPEWRDLYEDITGGGKGSRSLALAPCDWGMDSGSSPE